MTVRALPEGYERVTVGRAFAVAERALAPLAREALAAGTLYDFARRQPDAHELHGRQPAYAVRHPAADTRMVVRHNRHGGVLAALTGDRFLYPTRAPREFEISARLASAGVPTPRVLAYAVYRSGVFARSDVATRMAWPSRDLALALREDDAGFRRRALDLAATLVAQLSRAGARHHDLNAKNVLLEETGSGMNAILLDVDRVTFGWAPEIALAHNLRRLDRSLRKRRALFDEPVSDAEIAALASAAAERL